MNISFLQFKISDRGAQWARKVADLIEAIIVLFNIISSDINIKVHTANILLFHMICSLHSIILILCYNIK